MDSDELLSMDSHDSEDSDGSSIVIGPILYSQYQEHIRSGTNSKQRHILQSSDISSSECDAQKEAITSSEQKRSKRGKSKASWQTLGGTHCRDHNSICYSESTHGAQEII